MKKILTVFISFVCTFSLFVTVNAHEMNQIEFTDEKTVYVNSEEEFLAYPKDIHTKYTFIIPLKERSTTQCSSCGKPATYYILKEQTKAYTHGCFNNPLSPDMVSVYARYRYVDCSCGYTGKTFIDNAYTVYCNDLGITYSASYSTTVSKGYDVHQDMNYWD